MTSPELPPVSDLPIYNTLMANRSSALLSVAVSLKLFDSIESNQCTTPQDLSRIHQFSLRGADALLVGLKTLGLLESDTNIEDWYSTVYKLTILSKHYLLSSSDFYLGHLINMDSESFLTPQGLLEALKKDKPQVYGQEDPWEHQDAQGNEAAAERVRFFEFQSHHKFTLGMRSISIAPASAMSQQSILKSRQVLLDIGGGSGVHLAKMLSVHSNLKGIFYEIPSVFKTATPYFESHGLLDRIDLVHGNMFKGSWPRHHSSGARVDTILLSQILHDWPLQKGDDLLKFAFETLESGGMVVIHEKLLNESRSGKTL